MRRDRLLALLWPELDERRARNALSQLLFQLRRDLGPGTIITRGHEELAIAEGAIWCDAIEFERLVRTGEPQAAMDLYHGDLLDGLHVSGAGDFERWLEEERDRLRRLACSAAWELADRVEASDPGNIFSAAKRAYDLSGRPDEAALRRFVDVLVRNGDRAGAIHEYERFVRYLAEEFDAAPSPETQTLITGIRSKPDPVRRHPREVPLSSTAAPSAALLPETKQPQAGEMHIMSDREGSARVIAGFFRGPRVLATAAVATVMVLSGSALWYRSGTGSLPASAAEQVVAVFPFEYRGPSSDAYLGAGAAELVSASIASFGSVRVLDRAALTPDVAEGAITEKRARALSGHHGATSFLVGSVVEANGRIEINAEYHTKGIRWTSVSAHARGTTESIFVLVDSIVLQLMASRYAGSLTETTDRAEGGQMTTSLRSLSAYLDGDALYRAGRFPAAVERLRSAVADDSMFGTAWYRLSRAANWTGDYQLSTQAANTAHKLRMRMPYRARQHTEAWQLVLQGEPFQAATIYRALVSRDSSDVEALEELADIEFHWGATVGRPATDTRAMWERVLRFQPYNASALVHYARVVAAERDLHAYEALLPKIVALQPGPDRAAEVSALFAYAFGSEIDRSRAATRIGSLSQNVLWPIVQSVATSTDHLDAIQKDVAPLLFRSNNFTSREAGLVMFTAQLAVAQGRIRSAFQITDSAAAIDSQHAVEFEAVIALMPFVRESDRERRLMARLAAPRTGIVQHRTGVVDDLYLRGRLAIRQADEAQIARLIGALEAYSSVDSALMRRARYTSRLLRSEELRSHHRYREALTVLGKPGLQPDRRLPHIWSYAVAHDRFLRAELHRELGENVEALRWYSTFPDATAYDLMYLPVARLRRAELLEAAGDREAARVEYGRLLGLLQNADPQFRTAFKQAYTRFSALSSSPPRRSPDE